MQPVNQMPGIDRHGDVHHQEDHGSDSEGAGEHIIRCPLLHTHPPNLRRLYQDGTPCYRTAHMHWALWSGIVPPNFPSAPTA
jgi:hypothetical protein